MLTTNEQTRLEVLKSIPVNQRNDFINNEIKLLEEKSKLGDTIEQNYRNIKFNKFKQLYGKLPNFNSSDELVNWVYDKLLYSLFDESLDTSRCKDLEIKLTNNAFIDTLNSWLDTLPRYSILTEEQTNDYLDGISKDMHVIPLKWERELNEMLHVSISKSKSVFVQKAYIEAFMTYATINLANELHEYFKVPKGKIDWNIWKIAGSVTNSYLMNKTPLLSIISVTLDTDTDNFNSGLMLRVPKISEENFKELLNDIFSDE